MGVPRRFTVAERRARLAIRHALAPAHRAAGVVDAARKVVCLHATDPSTIFLSAQARVTGMTVADLERALYVDRSLVKHLAMRRTLFVFPRERLADAQAGASGRVAALERRRLSSLVERFGLHRDGARWLSKASGQVVAALSDGREMTFAELRDEVPLLNGVIPYGEGKTWAGQVAIGANVLTVLSASGAIVRATNTGAWTTSRPRWTAMAAWLGEPLEPRSEAEGTAALVEAWLRAFGPGTDADIAWWLGSTLTAVRRALATTKAVAVDIDGRVGYVLPDNLDDVGPVAPWIALLPPLDPTTMGWKERDWYLGPHKRNVFDTNGNAGATIWCDGRIVGGWRLQGTGGEVEVQLLEKVGRDARRAIDAEAARLTAWLAGTRVQPRFPSPLCKS